MGPTCFQVTLMYPPCNTYNSIYSISIVLEDWISLRDFLSISQDVIVFYSKKY